MLARYLRTSQRTRYAAMDPVHAAAIRNYLALTTRAYDVPGLYQQARPHLPGGREGELLHALFGGLIEHHDPDALAQFLDAHQDFTGQPLEMPRETGTLRMMTGPHETRGLLEHMASLYHTITGHPGFAFPGRRLPNRESYLNAYAPANLTTPPVRSAVWAAHRANTGPLGTLLDQAGMLRDVMRREGLPVTGIDSHVRSLPAILHPLTLVGLNDESRNLLSNPGASVTHPLATAVHTVTRQALRGAIIPRLLET